MAERGPETRTFVASDGYPLHIAVWPAQAEPRGHVVVLHGVQSHGGWYHRLGRSLSRRDTPRRFPTGAARAPISAIAAIRRRRAGSSATWSSGSRRCGASSPGFPSPWPGSVGAASSRSFWRPGIPSWSMPSRSICPGLHPRVGVTARERLKIAWAFFTNRRKIVSDPAVGPGALHR